MKKIRRKSEREVLTWHGEKEVPYFTFPSFEKLSEIVHGFSSRLGGVSEGCLSSMNLSFSRGDEPERVRENFRRMAESIGFSEENLVFSMQTHTTNVRRVGKEDCGRGLFRPVGYRDVDGLVTNEPEVVLATFYADCVPLFFMDPVRHCIGLSHTGWRGTVGKIGKVTVETMTREIFWRRWDLPSVRIATRSVRKSSGFSGKTSSKSSGQSFSMERRMVTIS